MLREVASHSQTAVLSLGNPALTRVLEQCAALFHHKTLLGAWDFLEVYLQVGYRFYDVNLEVLMSLEAETTTLQETLAFPCQRESGPGDAHNSLHD